MTSRVASRLAWSLWALITAIVVVALVLLAVSGFAAPEDAFGFPGFAAAFGTTLATVGALVASRRSGNAIGWIFLASGLCAALHELAMVYGAIAYQEPVPALPGAAYVAWLADWIWIPYTGGTLIFVPLLFPHGRLPGRRWRSAAVIGVLGMILAFVGDFSVRGPLDLFPHVVNPLALLHSSAVGNVLGSIGFSLIGLSGLIAVIGLAQRWRIAVGAERLQYKWLLAAGGLAGLAFGVATVERAVAGSYGAVMPYLLDVMLILGLGTIPVAVGIAITRHGLYEIDRLVSRTVSYALVVGVLVAVYAGGVFVLSGLLPLEGDLAVAASTLVVAALFDPLRKRVQQRVDRRFNRPRYDADLEMERFADRLRTSLDLDDLIDELLTVAATTVQPSSATVWIRGERR